MIEILYQDEYLIAVNKPCGMLVHRSARSDGDAPVLLQQLRDQTDRWLYPVHRIDRPTSGIVMFGFSPEIARRLNDGLTAGCIRKSYTALVRGWLQENVELDHPVKNEKGNLYPAQTLFCPEKYYTLPLTMGRYTEQRYSLLSVFPKSGRWHQIRQHLAHLRYYIINDRVHGDGKHNRIFTEQLGVGDFFLHACELSFNHPVSDEVMLLKAGFPLHWEKAISQLVCVEAQK